MPTLTIRNLPEDQHAALRVRAAKAGRSMEEEVRVLIAEALAEAPPTLTPEQVRADVEARVAKAQAMVREMFGWEMPKNAVAEFLEERRAAAGRGE
jgi:plasmid stability protein